MTTIADRISKRWEVHHPALLSAATLVAVLWRGDLAYSYAEASKWHLDQMYTAVFTISTVVTAFLFTFYTFIITGDRGFLAASRSSLPFRQTVDYTLRAIVVGSVLSVATIPMLVVQPVLLKGDLWMFFAAVWAALTVWAVSSFIRAAYLFAIFVGKQH